MLGAGLRQRVPAGIEKHEQRADVMARREGEELVDATAKPSGVLLLQQVVEKDAHRIHAQGFGPG